MTALRALTLIPLLGPLAACNDAAPMPDAAMPDAVADASAATTIAIRTSAPPALVAFRDGVAGAWRVATTTTPLTFEAAVHGPYVLAVVCTQPNGDVHLQQEARTLDDPRAIFEPCGPSLPQRTITGRMVQAGSVDLDFSSDRSTTAGWSFALTAFDGTYDLVAATTDRIAIRRGIAVGDNLKLTPDVDVVQQGAPLVDVAFSATNPGPSETVSASVDIATSAPGSAEVYAGPPATAKLAPDSVLRATDVQSVAVRATNGAAQRELVRPFRVGGGNTALTLPDPLAVQLSIADGKLLAQWPALPGFDFFDISTFAIDATVKNFRSYDLSISPGFVAATGLTHIAIDTDLPGYLPAWKIDFSRDHDRSIFLDRRVGADTAINSLFELAHGSQVSAPTIEQRRRAASRHARARAAQLSHPLTP